MEAKIQKWGNSLGIRIPITIIKDMALGNGSIVEINEVSNTIVIRPRKNLDNLLNEITAENLHTEIDFGSSEGQEVW